MFSIIKSNSASRITEIREYIEFIDPLIPKPPVTTPRFLNSAKGLVFVQLYGVIEYTVLTTISKTINLINSAAVTLNDVKPIILSLALNSELEAIYGAPKKKWDKRHELFKIFEINPFVEISEDILPTDGKNIHYPQLESIWKIFCLTDPIFHDVTFRGRLQDIVSNRVNIAHGNQAASEVGSRVTTNDLSIRLDDVSKFCSYFITVFEEYIEKEKFKK
ncbi:hypothetical protein AAE02nite_17380 [Adhaeribacter aerolatus]|uniref:RiboL-PSP-HEPN domain-containing protein n=1 Tax=Adhaeribacter aerolatus TaxID=670289 RepID=A0A512AWJ0_9BACT|nr:MAE_28990/MAE_18760 family HEPN-like nuclease [Adhaeribacter aerolatus]GEO04074.1 hypothetical protein AAE02nite_17380 [Adhaeribacter aerolatus]